MVKINMLSIPVRLVLSTDMRFAYVGDCAKFCFCSNDAIEAFNTRPSVNNVSARLAMKNVANSDMHRDLQRVEN